MANRDLRLGRNWKAFTRRMRELRLLAHGAMSTDHPVLAHIIPIRRCNLSCTYCNEYDNFSKPVTVEEMFRRIDKLAAIGTSIVTMRGGEPLRHPYLDPMIGRVRHGGMISGMIT